MYRKCQIHRGSQAATAAIVTKDQAREIGVARWVPEKPEDMDNLPHVESIMTQSRSAQRGLQYIVVGALLQFGPIVEKIITYISTEVTRAPSQAAPHTAADRCRQDIACDCRGAYPYAEGRRHLSYGVYKDRTLRSADVSV